MSKDRFLKGIAAVALVFGVSVSGFALDWTAYPDTIEKGNLIINAGVGFGTPLYGDMTIPPIIASVDYALPLGGLPFTLGGFFGFNQSKYEWSLAGYGYTYTYTGMAFGARLGYHPDFGVKNLDTYAALALGYYLFGAEAEYTGNWGIIAKTEPAKYDTFYYGFNLGARYFFTGNIGIWAELGYSALSYISAGITVKF